MDPRTFTQKVTEALQSAQGLASEHSHQQLSPLHVAIVLFEDPEGVARAAVAKQVGFALWFGRRGLLPYGAASEDCRRLRLPPLPAAVGRHLWQRPSSSDLTLLLAPACLKVLPSCCGN